MAPYQYPIAPLPPDRASLGVDAVIDFSRSLIVSDFRLVRQSNILAVIHKASEGGDYADTAFAARRPQAEAFVQAVAQATGRLPVVVYVHPTWANGDPLLGSGLSLGARITPDSILARCGLWVADYHDFARDPAGLGGDRLAALAVCRRRECGPPAYGQTSIVRGVSHCDRNLFNGDAAALYRFWSAAD